MTDNSTDDTTTPDMPDDETTDKSTDPEPEHVETELDDDQPDTGKEAARYRRRLRDVEAQRDALADRLETLQRREIERLAAQIVEKGAAVWLGGAAVEDFLDNDGEIDPDKVAQTAEHMRNLFGVARATKRLRNHVPREGANPRPAPTSYSPVDVVMGRDRD